MDRRYRILVLLIILGTTAGRLWLAAKLPLVDDEAYYWAWSRRLAWSYPDHPPAIAGLIRASISWFGDTPLGVRFGAIALSAGTAWLLFDLGRMLYGPIAGAIAAAGFQVIPVFSVGSIFAFPDAPFTFFWILALWALWRARAFGTRDWLLAGIAAGLAALSKLTALFLALSMVGFLAATRSERRWLRRPEPYVAAGIALALFLPVVIWNANHLWETFRRAREPIPWVVTGVPALNALVFAGAQFAYYGPLTFPLLMAALAAFAVRTGRSDPRSAFLLWGAIPIIGLTWLGSFDGLPKPHWHAPGFLLALIAAGALWPYLGERRVWRVAAAAGAILNAIAIAALVILPLRTDSPSAGEIWGWDQVAQGVDLFIQETPASPGRFIMTQRYQVAGPLEFQLKGRHVVMTVFGGDAYDLWVPLQALIDHNAVFINDLASGPGIPIDRMFQRVERLPPIEVTLNGRVVRRFFAYRGFGFRGFPRPGAFPETPETIEKGRLLHRR